MRLIERKLLRRKIQAAEHGRRFVAAEPAAHGVLQRFGLLEDFLEHVVRIAVQADVVAARFERRAPGASLVPDRDGSTRSESAVRIASSWSAR